MISPTPQQHRTRSAPLARQAGQAGYVTCCAIASAGCVQSLRCEYSGALCERPAAFTSIPRFSVSGLRTMHAIHTPPGATRTRLAQEHKRANPCLPGLPRQRLQAQACIWLRRRQPSASGFDLDRVLRLAHDTHVDPITLIGLWSIVRCTHAT